MKKLGLGGGTTSQRPLLENPIFFIKGNFLSHLLPLVFLSKSCVCSQSCACYVLKCLCALVWIFDVWIIASKKIPFFFLFSSTFLIYLFPYASFLHASLVSLPCPHLLCCYTPLLHHLILLPSSYYFITLFCFALFHCLMLFRCLMPSCFVLPCCLATSLPSCFKYLSMPPFVASLPCCLTPCCIVSHTLLHCVSLPYTLCWLVFPSSFLFNKEEFGGANSLAPRKKVFFLVLCFLLFVFYFL